MFGVPVTEENRPGEGGEAETCKEEGNLFYKAERFKEAIECYRKGVAISSANTILGQALRVNLCTCLRRIQSGVEEVVRLCGEVLEADEHNTKAYFKRGLARQLLARSTELDDNAKREALAAARRDLKEAARLEPQDRQVRFQLEHVTKELRELPPRADSA